MRVAVDGRSLGSGLGGDETMLRGALRGLATSAGNEDEVVVLASTPDVVPADVLAAPQVRQVTLRRRPGAVHFAYELPHTLERIDPTPDAVLSVTHAPLWGSSPTALVVNDVSFLRGGHHYPLATRLRLRHLVARQVWSSAVVVTVSDFCRRDIIEAYGLPPGRVVTVPNCIEPPRPLSGPEEVEAEAWLGSRGVRGPFVLYLGNIHPRKNVPLLVRSFARALRDGSLADHQLVLAGGSWWGDDLDRQLQCTTPGTVIRVGRVSDIQREFLLRRAVALAYLAVHEGFGLPPLEAMARGTPVLAARSGAVPEVVGDGAFLVDPEDEEAVRDGLVRVVADDDLRDFLTDRGRERAAGFGPHRSGPAIHAALSTAASAGRRRSGPAVWARIHRSRYAPVDERRIAATGGTDGPRREPTRPDQDDTRGDRRLPGRAAAGHPVLDQP